MGQPRFRTYRTPRCQALGGSWRGLFPAVSWRQLPAPSPPVHGDGVSDGAVRALIPAPRPHGAGSSMGSVVWAAPCHRALQRRDPGLKHDRLAPMGTGLGTGAGSRAQSSPQTGLQGMGQAELG